MEKDKGRGSVLVGGCGVLVIHFFSVYAPLAKRFSLPIRRVRGREARFVDSLFFATPKSKRVLMHARRYKVLTRWLMASLYFGTPTLLILFVLDSLFYATPKSKRVLMHAWRHMLLTLWLVLGRAQVPYPYCMHFAK